MGKTYKDHPERKIPKGIKRLQKANKGEKVKRQRPEKFNWRDAVSDEDINLREEETDDNQENEGDSNA